MAAVFSPYANENVGVGFKLKHVDDILASCRELAFVEVHAENLMGGGGPLHAALDAVRARMPVSVHGVGLSIGGAEPIDMRHVERLKKVANRFEGFVVSEHLAWSTHGGRYLNDLLPIQYDEPTLVRVAEHVSRVQDALGRSILIENPSTYFPMIGSSMDEVDFLSELSSRTGCGLLLDLNNVVVSQWNRGGSPIGYLKKFPLDRVRHLHLAGHSKETLPDGSSILIDDHGSRVGAHVLTLFSWVTERVGKIPTVIEWDQAVPGFDVLLEQVESARRIQALLSEAA